MRTIQAGWLLVFLSFAFCARSTVRLPAFFSSNMVLQQNASAPVWGWAAPGSTVSVLTSWNGKTYKTAATADGRWKLVVSTPGAGGPYRITISDGETLTIENVLIGEVWFCSGQSNMQMPMKGFDRAEKQPVKNSAKLIATSANEQIRLFTMGRSDQKQAVDSCGGVWAAAAPGTVANFSAVAYQFARRLQKELKVPVGVISSSWGGTPIEAWMSKEALASVMNTQAPDSLFQKRRAGLYNGMVHPLSDFALKGFLWYQGEANKKAPSVYARLMQALVTDWRRQWKNENLPFYFVQIAPMKNNTEQTLLPYLWEAQEAAQKQIAHSGMVSTVDAGEVNNVHPANKTAVAERLALLALSQTYDRNDIRFASPVFKSVRMANGKAILSFENATGGWKAPSDRLTLFEVAGEDKVFYPADAVIDGNDVVVSSPQVKSPAAVRYAFQDWVVGELFNKEDLPLLPFRTDNW